MLKGSDVLMRMVFVVFFRRIHTEVCHTCIWIFAIAHFHLHLDGYFFPSNQREKYKYFFKANKLKQIKRSRVLE